MKVSILVPCFKVENYIRRCAESLFRQTYQDIEYIFVDDASPDRSATILQEVMEAYPHRATQTRIITHPFNRGLAAARNTAIEAATGEYLYMVDSDDYIEDDTIDLMTRKAKELSADLVIGNFIFHSGKDERPYRMAHHEKKEDLVLSMLSSTVPHQVWNNLMKRHLFTQHHIRAKEGANYGEDLQIMVQVAYYAQKVTYCDGFTYHYDLRNPQSLINVTHATTTKETIFQFLETARFAIKFFEDKESIYLDKARTLEFHFLYWGLSQLCTTGQHDAFAEVSKSIKKTPQQYWTLSSWFKPLFYHIASSYSLMRLYLYLRDFIHK